MKFSFSKIKISAYFYIISLIFFSIFHFAKTRNINLYDKEVIKRNRRDEMFEEMIKKIENLEESIKQYDNNLHQIIEKNHDSKLQIEINKVYVKILYALIVIFLLVIIFIIIIKFYNQCIEAKTQNIEKNNSAIASNIKDKGHDSSADKTNIISNNK